MQILRWNLLAWNHTAQLAQGDVVQLQVRKYHGQILTLLAVVGNLGMLQWQASPMALGTSPSPGGYTGVVQILLTAKANVNIQLTTANRNTPLHAAASAGCEQVVERLCEAGNQMEPVVTTTLLRRGSCEGKGSAM